MKYGGFHKWGPKMDSLKWNVLFKWMIWGYHHFRKPPWYFERWHCSHKGQIRREEKHAPFQCQNKFVPKFWGFVNLCELFLTYCILLQLLLKCFCLPRELAKLQPLGNFLASEADPHGVRGLRGRLACAVTIWASQVWPSPWLHGVVRQKWHAPERSKRSKHRASAWRREQTSGIIQQWSFTVINSNGSTWVIYCTFCVYCTCSAHFVDSIWFYERINLSISKVRFLAMIMSWSSWMVPGFLLHHFANKTSRPT